MNYGKISNKLFWNCFSKLIFKTGFRIVQTGNGIISPISRPLINKTIFYKMFHIFRTDFKIDCQNRNGNYPNRKLNYFDLPLPLRGGFFCLREVYVLDLSLLLCLKQLMDFQLMRWLGGYGWSQLHYIATSWL